MNTIVELKGISKKYKNNRLFENMDLIMNKGEICGIIGENGSGKSVLLKMICGLVLPDSGTIEVEGIRIENGIFPQNIGVILDCAGFLPGYTGFENLNIIANVRKKIGRKEIEDTIKRVGLEPKSTVKVGKYSLGMKQRLALAQAVMEKPDILILDEPMNGIDMKTVAEMRQLLKELNEENETTIIMTSHHLEDINDLCTTVYEIKNLILHKREQHIR